MFWNCVTYHSIYNILFQYACKIYWCSETVSHVTPCTIFCFNIHVRYTDVLKLYHMSLHVQYSISVYLWDIVILRNCITCHYMYNILFQYTCEFYSCSETLSPITPCTIFCYSIHVRYTDVLKLCHMSLPVQYSVSVYMWDILMFWIWIIYHYMYNILFQYTCEIYWCSETISHVTPCTIFCFSIQVRYTDVLKLCHISVPEQYSVSVYMWDILMFWNCVICQSLCSILYQYTLRYTDILKHCHMSLPVQYSVSIYMWDILMFWNCITCLSLYNILFHYTCEIYWCSETVSHIIPCTIFSFNIRVRCTDFLKLYHISVPVQYSVSLYMWDILMFWNCITYPSLYNILFHYTCEIYWCSETVSHISPCTIFCFKDMWDILMFLNCITYHSLYNFLFQYTCEIYWCSETLSHFSPCTIFCFNIHMRYNDVLNLHHMSLHVQYSFSIYTWDIIMFWNWVTYDFIQCRPAIFTHSCCFFFFVYLSRLYVFQRL